MGTNEMTATVFTCVAPVNIAVIKYWGKRDTELILPLNESLSGTLDENVLHSKTSVLAGPDLKEDRMWLNGKEEDINAKRTQNCLKALRELAKDQGLASAEYNVHIVSSNNFPTAAGLASSASGFACLVFSLAKALGVKARRDELSLLARRGSGSACRSLHGGWVKWERGTKADGSDSIAVQTAPASAWPEMEVVILVVDAGKKAVSSTSGMQRSVETSPLLDFRAKNTVTPNCEKMEKAILEKDFSTFAKVTMQESNQFHACCLDTLPPIVYMNDTSHLIVKIIHHLQDRLGQPIAAYTYDAGPNAVLYLERKHVPLVMSVVEKCFFENREDMTSKYTGLESLHTILSEGGDLDSDLVASLEPFRASTESRISRVIHSKIGDGPRQLDDPKEHLMDANGMPLSS
eukprot:Clim_evm40s152 gene=Clim_evmTU40s152